MLDSKNYLDMSDTKNLDFYYQKRTVQCRRLGLMALYNFERGIECLEDLMKYCDYVAVRFQMWNDPPSDMGILDYIMRHKKIIKILISNEKWNGWNWREDLIVLGDTLFPDVLLFIDDDEKFGPGFEDELFEFMQNPVKKYMSFNFEMHDKTEPWPKDRHVKVIKWRPRITYLPYPGWARTATYLGLPNVCYNAETKIIHYCNAGKEKKRHTGIKEEIT